MIQKKNYFNADSINTTVDQLSQQFESTTSFRRFNSFQLLFVYRLLVFNYLKCFFLDGYSELYQKWSEEYET